MDLRYTPQDEAFRAEVRAFLAGHLPADIRAHMAAGHHPTAEMMRRWTRILHHRGWSTPGWPRAYGGPGWSPMQRYIFGEELQRAPAPTPLPFGANMAGPVIYTFGSAAQQERFLPGIRTLDTWWCQGFSEPGAGSDLASLKTRARRDGDHYVVNGQKTWTSGGQWADKCFALVRTDKSQKHAGISFLLIDMDAPGVEVKPIRLISGASPFCETFFTDVKVPKENLVGQEGQGWAIGTRLLQHERSSLSGGGGSAGRMLAGKPVSALAKEYRGEVDGKIADGDLRMRIVRHEMDTRAFMLTLRRAALDAKSNQGPSAATSIMKNVGARIMQDKAELGIEIMGMNGVGWEGEGFSEAELTQTRTWLWGKAVSIYGGSTEIQNNVIAKRILGMLDHQ